MHRVLIYFFLLTCCTITPLKMKLIRLYFIFDFRFVFFFGLS